MSGGIQGVQTKHAFCTGKLHLLKEQHVLPLSCRECCWCETLTALLESRLLGINEADIRESGNNNRKHMKTQPFFVFTKQYQPVASPHRFTAPSSAPSSCPRAGTWELRRLHALGNSPSPLPGLPGNVGTGTGTPWNTLHWEIMVDRDHGKTMSVVSLKLVHHITSTS